MEFSQLTAIILKKSSSPSVSSMDATVCRAIVSLKPFILPLTSTRITTSFGDVAAWIYLRMQTSGWRNVWNYKPCCFCQIETLDLS